MTGPGTLAAQQRWDRYAEQFGQRQALARMGARPTVPVAERPKFKLNDLWDIPEQLGVGVAQAGLGTAEGLTGLGGDLLRIPALQRASEGLDTYGKNLGERFPADTKAGRFAHGVGRIGGEVGLALAPGAALGKVGWLGKLGKGAALGGLAVDAGADALIEAGQNPEGSTADFLGFDKLASTRGGRAAVGAATAGVLGGVFEGVRATRAARKGRLVTRSEAKTRTVKDVMDALEGKRVSDLSPAIARDSQTRLATVAPTEESLQVLEAAKGEGKFRPNELGVNIPEGGNLTGEQMRAGVSRTAELAEERGRLLTTLDSTPIGSPARADLETRLGSVTADYVAEAEKVTGSVSEAARLMGIHAQMLRRAPDGMYGISSYVRKELGGALTEGQMDDVLKFVKRDGDKVADVDHVGLARWIEDQKEPLSWGDSQFYTTLVRSGMLSALYSPLRSVVGNTTSVGLKAVSAPARILFDSALTKLVRAVSGKELDRSARVSPRAIKDAISGIPSDVVAAKDVLVKGLTPADAQKMEVRTGRKLESGINIPEFVPGIGGKDAAQVWGQLWYRAQGMVDTPIRRMITRSSITSQAEELVTKFDGVSMVSALKKQGMREVDAMAVSEMKTAQRIESLIESPTPNMQARAIHDSAFTTFQNETVLNDMVQGARSAAHKNSGVGAAFDVTIPFSRTPSAIAVRSLEASPLGLLHDANDLFTLVARAGGKSDAALQAVKDRLVRRVGDQSITLPLAYLIGGSLAAQGKITGAMPTDPRDREEFSRAGKVPYGVNVGGRWWSLAQMPPLGHVIALGAIAAEVAKDAENARAAGAEDVPGVPEMAAAMGVGGINIISETPLAQGAQRVSEFMSAQGGIGNRGISALASTASSVVPNLLATVARADDPIREKRRSQVGPAVRDAIVERLPIASRELPVRSDRTLGNTISRERTPLARALSMVDPFGSSPDRTTDNPVIAQFEKVGAAPSSPSKLPGEGELEYSARTAEEGKKVNEVLVAMFAGGDEARRSLSRYGVDPSISREYRKLDAMGTPEARQAQQDIIKNVIATVRGKLTTQRKRKGM